MNSKGVANMRFAPIRVTRLHARLLEFEAGADELPCGANAPKAAIAGTEDELVDTDPARRASRYAGLGCAQGHGFLVSPDICDGPLWNRHPHCGGQQTDAVRSLSGIEAGRA